MASLIRRYAVDLLNYAREQDQLEDFYTHALILTQSTDWSGISSFPAELESYLRLVPQPDLKAVLSEFIEISRDHLGLLDATVISAVPLTDQQRIHIEQKLTHIFNKQIRMVTKVDPTLLGGLRIVAGHTIIDNTIKKKLFDMKKSVYRGVYFK